MRSAVLGLPAELSPDRGDDGRAREKITIDRSSSNKAAIGSIQGGSGLSIEMRQSKYLNNIVEQDHRAIKRIVRSMHMIRKGQLERLKEQSSSAANQFYSLAF